MEKKISVGIADMKITRQEGARVAHPGLPLNIPTR